MLEKTLESPLNCKEIQQGHPKENEPWMFIGRTDAEAEQTTGDGEEQENLAYCSPWGHKENDMTEQLDTFPETCGFM